MSWPRFHLFTRNAPEPIGAAQFCSWLRVCRACCDWMPKYACDRFTARFGYGFARVICTVDGSTALADL